MDREEEEPLPRPVVIRGTLAIAFLCLLAVLLGVLIAKW